MMDTMTVVSVVATLVAIGLAATLFRNQRVQKARQREAKLRDAAWEDDEDKLRELIDDDVDVNATDESTRETALIVAARRGHADIARMLIRAGGDVTATNRDLKTALMFAAYNGHAECTRVLIEAGSDVMATGPQGNTAVDFAKAEGHRACVDLLQKAIMIAIKGGL